MNVVGSVKNFGYRIKSAFDSAWEAFWMKGFTSVGGRTTTAKEVVTESTALTLSAVWCATNLYCGTGASLPLPVYRGAMDDSRKRARDHRLFRLLNVAPNDEMTAFAFRSLMWQWQLNWGNAYAEIVREGNEPTGDLVALWPIDPSRVIERRDDNDNLFYRVANSGRPDADVPLWRILHLPNVISDDGVHGKGVITHARETIGSGIAQEKHAAHWFGGAAVPRAVIEHAGRWEKDAREAFREEWDEIYGSPTGHRVALLQGGATMKTLSLSANDSQFIETRQFTVEEIARWYNIPPHFLQHLLRATNNNIEELGINFVRYSLIPYLKVWEQAINAKLLTQSEQADMYTEHNVDALLRGNSEMRAKFFQMMVSCAIMTRNECRKLENLDPVAGGDTFLVQGAQVPLDDDGKPESEFVGNVSTISTQQSGQPTPAQEPDDDESARSSTTIRQVTKRVERIIKHDLERFLTKESKAMQSAARKPHEFVQLVDGFYATHTAIVRDEMTETLGALTVCGVESDIDVFVAAWVSEGKAMMLDASGTAMNAEELTTMVQTTLDSRSWTERPLRAVEGLVA